MLHFKDEETSQAAKSESQGVKATTDTQFFFPVYVE